MRLEQLIHLFLRVESRQVHGSMELFNGTGRHLNLAVTGFATLQRFDVFAIEGEIFQVGKLWRIAELTDCQVLGQLAKAVEITRKLEIAFRRGMDVDRTEHETLIGNAGVEGLGNRLPAADGRDLPIAESDILLEVGL